MENPQPGSAPASQKPMYDQSYTNTMVHFYRGELGRIMVWRQRLDTTTTWAITSTTTLIAFALSQREVPHIVFFFNILIVWIMLWIESRRYRFYDAFRARVRMLEAHFLLPVVMQNALMLHGEWQKLMCEDLLMPSFKISKFEAVGRRLKRNYAFIFAIILLAWLTKVFIHAKIPITDFSSFYMALKVGSIPGWVTVVVFLGTFFSLIGITAYIAKFTSGEVTEFTTHRKLWKI